MFKKANDEGRGMALAVANLTVCVEKFNDSKAYADALGGAYQSNFNTKAAEAQALLAKAIDENKKIYYEANIPTSELAKPDPQNFVNLLQMNDEINVAPELDDKLRHIVPPAVRVLQDELKGLLQQMIQ